MSCCFLFKIKKIIILLNLISVGQFQKDLCNKSVEVKVKAKF